MMDKIKRLTINDPERGLLIREEEQLWKEKGYYDKGEFYKIMRHLAEKLAKYENLEERGRFLKIPVAVGETVYVINRNDYGVFVDEGEVLEVSNQRIWAGDACFDYSDIGKTVFLTEKDAEAALKTEEERKV